RAVRVDVAARSQIICRHPRVLRVLASDVHVDAGSPLTAVADAAAVIGRDYHVAFLKEVLVKAVVNGVIPLYVPAVVVLVDAVAVDPHDGGMLLVAIEILGNEEPRRYLLPVRPRVMHE